MRVECGPIRLEFTFDNAKYVDNGAVVVYLTDKTGMFRGDMYLSPKEASVIRNRPARQVETNNEGKLS